MREQKTHSAQIVIQRSSNIKMKLGKKVAKNVSQATKDLRACSSTTTLSLPSTNASNVQQGGLDDILPTGFDQKFNILSRWLLNKRHAPNLT